jgi:hypothetical protein
VCVPCHVVVEQRGTQDVLQAYVEIVFDNSDLRLSVSIHALACGKGGRFRALWYTSGEGRGAAAPGLRVLYVAARSQVSFRAGGWGKGGFREEADRDRLPCVLAWVRRRVTR